MHPLQPVDLVLKVGRHNDELLRLRARLRDIGRMGRRAWQRCYADACVGVAAFQPDRQDLHVLRPPSVSARCCKAIITEGMLDADMTVWGKDWLT